MKFTSIKTTILLNIFLFLLMESFQYKLFKQAILPVNYTLDESFLVASESLPTESTILSCSFHCEKRDICTIFYIANEICFMYQDANGKVAIKQAHPGLTEKIFVPADRYIQKHRIHENKVNIQFALFQ